MSVDRKKSPAFRIFHFYYEVILPQHHLYSREYLETFGIPTSGDSAVDKELANTETVARKTIAQMAELVSEGAQMSLVDPKQAVEIYQTIQEHLRSWQDKVNAAPVDIKPPVEDLRLLDELAKLVYPIAKRYMKDDIPIGYFEKLSNRAMPGISRKSDKKKQMERDQGQKKYNSDEHISISDSIAKSAFSKATDWRR